MRIRLISLPVIGLLALGCSSPPENAGAPVGDSAQVFAGDWKTFLAGTWSPTSGESIDPELAKQLGVEAVNDPGEVDPGRWWTFKSDGTFTYNVEKETWTVAGKWAPQGEGVHLDYLTYNGKEWNAAQQEIAAEAEKGGSAAIIDDLIMEGVFKNLPRNDTLKLESDKKRVYFEIATGDPGMGGMGNMKKILARMSKEAK